MIARTLLPGLALLLASGCGARPTGTVAIRWPPDGARLHGHLAVAFDYRDVNASGNVQVVVDGEHVHAAGRFPDELASGRVELFESPGHHEVTVRLVDDAGAPFSPAIEASIEIDVVAESEARRVWFVQPTDGETVGSPLTVEAGLAGMALAGPQTAATDRTAGRLRLIVDGTPVSLGVPLPAGSLSFTGTTAHVPLQIGRHTLTLQFADAQGVSFGEDLSATITVDVN